MSSVIERIKELNQKRTDAEKAIAKEGKGLFVEAAKKLFDEHPLLVSFGWSQYTPYFNDGEECTFAANTDYIQLKVFGEDNEDDFDLASATRRWDGRKWNDTPADERSPRQIIGGQVMDFLHLFSDADLKLMFGDHAAIKVTANGVEAEEYDHE